jgi:hypothetical protein
MTVYVHALVLPSRKIRFTLPDPPEGIVVADEQWLYPSAGDRINGIELDLGDCSAGGYICLGYLTTFVFFPPPGCPVWMVDPDSDEMQDCDGAWRSLTTLPTTIGCPGPICSNFFQVCPSLRPYNLNPPDGATGVPLDVQLTWTGVNYYCDVRISTDPACGADPWLPVECAPQAFSPDFLQPETTYYWQVRTYPDACHGGGASSLQAFTTTAAVPVSTTTWGRVKAIYRD